jgi:hypothetical protein
LKIYDKEKLGSQKFFEFGEEKAALEGIKPIAETDEDIEIFSILIINNIAYSVGTVNHSQSRAMVWKLPIQNVFVRNAMPRETDNANNIVCPYCGFEDIDSWELRDDDDEKHECGNCNSVFSYQRTVTVTYSTQPVSKTDDIIKIK